MLKEMKPEHTKGSQSILLKFALGLFFAVTFGFALGFGVDALLNAGIFMNFGGDKSSAFIALFFGIPAGSMIGFTIIDRKIEKRIKTNWSGIVLGTISCAFLGTIGSAALLDFIGEKAIFVIPVMMVLLALGSYQATHKYN